MATHSYLTEPGLDLQCDHQPCEMMANNDRVRNTNIVIAILAYHVCRQRLFSDLEVSTIYDVVLISNSLISSHLTSRLNPSSTYTVPTPQPQEFI